MIYTNKYIIITTFLKIPPIYFEISELESVLSSTSKQRLCITNLVFILFIDVMVRSNPLISKWMDMIFRTPQWSCPNNSK